MMYEYMPTSEFIIQGKENAPEELRLPPLGRNDYLVVARSIIPSKEHFDPLNNYGPLILKGLAHITDKSFAETRLTNFGTQLQLAEEALRGSTISYLNAPQKLINSGLDPILFLTENAILNPATTTVVMRMAGATLTHAEATIRHDLQGGTHTSTSFMTNSDHYSAFMHYPDERYTLPHLSFIRPRFTDGSPIKGSFYIPTELSNDESDKGIKLPRIREVLSYAKGHPDKKYPADAWYQIHTYPRYQEISARMRTCVFPRQ